MRNQRRSGRTSTQPSIEDEIVYLRDLDLRGLRSRWQGVFQKARPCSSGPASIVRRIAYRLRADRLGDLDHATRQMLNGLVAKEMGPALSARLASFDQKRTKLAPGTVLVGNGIGSRIA
jgi:hypothetical protein